MGGIRASKKRSDAPQLNVVTTPEMYAAIRAQCVITGLSMRQVVHDALYMYFANIGKPIGSEIHLEAVGQTQTKVDELAQVVSLLRGELTELRKQLDSRNDQRPNKSGRHTVR